MKIYYKGKIYTGDASKPEAEAVAVLNGRIAAIGNSKEIISQFPFFERTDLENRRVLPAFTDAHTHFAMYCLKQEQVDLQGLTTKKACLERIHTKTKSVPKGRWIKGGGWNQNLWTPAQFPTKHDLDPITPDHPVAIDARDYHSLWVNSAALKLAGIDRTSTFDLTGEIVKDDKGEPTGILKEEARRLIWKVMGEETVDDRAEALRKNVHLAWQNGLSGVHCMETQADFEAYQRLQGELKLRVTFYMPIRFLDSIIGVKMQTGYGNEWLRFGGMKIFMDGTLGSQTAHMIEPFENSSNFGTEIIDQKSLDEYVLKSAENNISCAIHAIGDMAVRKVLNAFELSHKKFPQKNLRQRVEHAQLIHPDDMSQFSKIGAIASMQAIHIPEDIDTADKYWGKRARWAYPFKSLLDCGTKLALGSDVPIETCNVFEGIYAALKRTRRGSNETWYAEETISLKQAIHAYTMGAAYASGEENIKGNLMPGKVADFMALSDDIFETEPEQIPQLKVAKMIVGGETVYEK